MLSASTSASRIVNVKPPPSLLQAAEIISSDGPSPVVSKCKLAPSTSSPALYTSEDELNTSFGLGGLPGPHAESSSSPVSKPKDAAAYARPLTLSDIIVPPAHALSRSGIDMDIDMESHMLDEPEDDLVLKSIYAKIVTEQRQPARPCVASETGMQQLKLQASALEMMQQKRESIYKAASRPTSEISFEGPSSFEEARWGFEFHDARPLFYPPAGFVLLVFLPADNLRLNRPRPRGRPTPGGRTPAASNRPPVPASTNRPIRICKLSSNQSIPVLTPMSMFSSPGPKCPLYACTTMPLDICCYSHLLQHLSLPHDCAAASMFQLSPPAICALHTTACFAPLHVSFTFTHSSRLSGPISPSSLAAYAYIRGGKGSLEVYVDASDVDPDMGEIPPT
ncbi:hypothetical protein CVT25_005296 [Psilocybe cyanescens]|uniref:Uncharacterized protein n=1 Tax=Psilocybe cyanescens TaxID=93625 RepID=A0A409WWU3_PSICY|nr:hypothetical protein CVT25_005296 [Psilocybe cyanescens]